MTDKQINSLSYETLVQWFESLPAPTPFYGDYTGRLLRVPWLVSFLARYVWGGKRFYSTTVINLVLGDYRIEGLVAYYTSEAVITYPSGLKDRIRSMGNGKYIGRLERYNIWFTLEKKQR